MTAIVVLGGAFNPVHCGHKQALDVAAAEVERLGYRVEATYLACATDTYCEKKYGRAAFIPGEHRLAMCNLVAEDDERQKTCQYTFSSAAECGMTMVEAAHAPDTRIFVVRSCDKESGDPRIEFVIIPRGKAALDSCFRVAELSATKVREKLAAGSWPDSLHMLTRMRMLAPAVGAYLEANPSALALIVPSAAAASVSLKETIALEDEESLDGEGPDEEDSLSEDSESIRPDGRMRSRKEIAKETVEILQIAMQGEEADTELPDVILADSSFPSAVSAAVVGSAMQLEQYGRRGLPKPHSRGPFRVEFTNETTVASVLRLAQEGCHVAALNFASATNPGGGFLGGADAQEESLARSSGLYPCLAQFKDSYYSLPINGGLYTHSMIFSPHVPFFRGDDGELLTPCLASVITSPAVNFKRIRDPSVARKTHNIMKERARRIFHLAAAEEVDVLILGAWGCGVFAGSPVQMAEIFHEIIIDPKFKHIRCVFAIPDASVRSVFSCVFAGCAPHSSEAEERQVGRRAAQSERKWKGKPHQKRAFREFGYD